MALVVRVLAVEGIHTGRLKTIMASAIAGHSRAREALRRNVLLEARRCVCLEGVVVGRLRRWVVSARGRR
jgi:hypothetical protein